MPCYSGHCIEFNKNLTRKKSFKIGSDVSDASDFACSASSIWEERPLPKLALTYPGIYNVLKLWPILGLLENT
jgi:hypothetical protein